MKRRLKWFMPVCRRLPPYIAYRLYYRYVDGIEGSPDVFENARAMIGDARLTSSMADVVDAQFAFHGCSEWLGLTLCRLLTSRGQTIFEIGANLGTDTLNLAAVVGSAGAVVAVEPGARCFEKLRARVESNQLRQVRLVKKAVSDSAQRVTLQAAPEGNSGMAYVASAGAGDAGAMDTTTLDALASEHGPPHFVWMDIEGYELKALRGASSTLRSARPFIYTEVDRGHLERAGDSLEAFYAFAAEHDYELVDPTNWRLPQVTPSQRSGYYHANWLMVPREKLGVLKQVAPRFLAARLLPRL